MPRFQVPAADYYLPEVEVDTHHVRRVVCGHARDAKDASTLLSMLGLGKEEA